MKNKPLILVGAMAGAVILLYIITIVLRKKKANAAMLTTNASNTKKGTSGQIVDEVVSVPNKTLFTIKRGNTGDHVKYVQMALNYIAKKKKITGVNLVADGSFGLATENALVKLYGVKWIDKTLAQKIASDAGLSGFATVLNYFK